MRKRTWLILPLLLACAGVWLTGADPRVSGAPSRMYVYDSGIVKLGPNQKLVMMVDASLDADVVWHEYGYGAETCQPGTNRCITIIIDVDFGPTRILAIGEGASDTVFYSPAYTGQRITVTSRNPNLRVTAQIIDTITGMIYSGYVVQSGPNA